MNFCPLKNVNIARFTRNTECDFFYDFQTLWNKLILPATIDTKQFVIFFGFFDFWKLCGVFLQQKNINDLKDEIESKENYQVMPDQFEYGSFPFEH